MGVENIKNKLDGVRLKPAHSRKDTETVKEKMIERKLVNAVKEMGGISPKFVSPGFDGMPDRIILLPGSKIAFIEVKATGKKPRPLQLARHELLRKLGFKVFVLDDAADINKILKEIGGFHK